MFSWHEIGKFDLPPTIDYILEKTNYSRCHYIGHSQGTTAFFVMMSELPHYNEKIALMTALAPIVFMTHIDNEPAKMFAKYVNLFEVRTEKFCQYIIQKINRNGITACQNAARFL